MTKIGLCSDLHIEHHRDRINIIKKLSQQECDVLVLAGDIDSCWDIEQTLEMFCEHFKDVVYVNGNHECYDTSIKAFSHNLKKLEIDNLHFLDNEQKTVQGIEFIGGTLWFGPSIDAQPWEDLMSDFTYIKNFKKEVYKKNKEFIQLLEEKLDKNSVVVTHHLIVKYSVSPRFVSSPLNPFFLCDQSKLIAERKPKLCLHGHTHDELDYIIGETRVCCNPRAYPHECKPNYSLKVLEV